MIPRLTHSRISPLPREVTVCSSAKVNGPAFDSIGIPLGHKTRYHALIFNVKSLFESARWQQHGKSDRNTNWTATHRVAASSSSSGSKKAGEQIGEWIAAVAAGPRAPHYVQYATIGVDDTA